MYIYRNERGRESKLMSDYLEEYGIGESHMWYHTGFAIVKSLRKSQQNTLEFCPKIQTRGTRARAPLVEPRRLPLGPLVGRSEFRLPAHDHGGDHGYSGAGKSRACVWLMRHAET